MPQAATKDTPALPGLPRTRLTAEQQLMALQRVQAQAEQRVKLGMQLFKAAEAHTSQHRVVLDQVKAEQAKFRAEMREDMTRTLEPLDQCVTQMEEDFTSAVHALETKIERLQNEWTQAQQRLEGMMKRSEAMLDQSRTLLERAVATPSATPVVVAKHVVVSQPVTAPQPVALPPVAPPVRHSVVDAVASTDADSDTPEFYRQVLAKLREQDETGKT